MNLHFLKCDIFVIRSLTRAEELAEVFDQNHDTLPPLVRELRMNASELTKRYVIGL